MLALRRAQTPAQRRCGARRLLVPAHTNQGWAWYSAVASLRVPLGRVAEWQTRWLQVPVFERMWGFKSPLAHWKTPAQLGSFRVRRPQLLPDFYRVASGTSPAGAPAGSSSAHPVPSTASTSRRPFEPLPRFGAPRRARRRPRVGLRERSLANGPHNEIAFAVTETTSIELAQPNVSGRRTVRDGRRGSQHSESPAF